MCVFKYYQVNLQLVIAEVKFKLCILDDEWKGYYLCNYRR